MEFKIGDLVKFKEKKAKIYKTKGKVYIIDDFLKIGVGQIFLITSRNEQKCNTNYDYRVYELATPKDIIEDQLKSIFNK